MGVTSAAAASSAVPAESQPAADPFRDLRWVSSGLGLLTLAALAITWSYGYALVGWRFQPQVLWALAMWSAGAGLGFLFAIPRVLQGQGGGARAGAGAADGAAPSPPAPARTAAVYEQRVNTNLEEISDWLTKIIVGITLVQLNQFPPLLTRLSTQVVADLPAGPEDRGPSRHLGYGIAVIIVFFILGFLFGYLVTRLYLQGALARAERGLSDEGRLELQRRAVTAETNVELLSNVTAGPAAAPQGLAAPSPQVVARLQALCAEYDAVKIPDLRARTAEKDRLAKALFQVVVNEGVSRDWLADQGDEALMLALASAVQAIPEAGDAARLLKAGPKVTRRHVRYRVASAFGRLLDAGLVPASLVSDVRGLLTKYLTDADPPLAELIQAVQNQIDKRASPTR